MFLLRRREDEAILSLEGHAELKELDKDIRELLEESIAVLGIALDVLLEGLILDKGHISGQHHERGSGLVSVLKRAVPLLLVPLLLNKQTEELVAENSWAEVPGTVKPGAVGVAATQGMGADQCNHLAVIKAHAGEDIANVTLILGGIRQTTIGSASGDVLVLTAGSPGDGGTTCLLNCAGTTEGPQIRVSDPGELSLDGLEEITGNLQTGVGAVV